MEEMKKNDNRIGWIGYRLLVLSSRLIKKILFELYAVKIN